MVRASFLSWLVLVSSACLPSQSGEEAPPLCSAALPGGRPIPALDATGDLAGAGVCLTEGQAAVAPAPELHLPGFVPIGPAVLVRIDRPVPPSGLDLTLPAWPDRLPPGPQLLRRVVLLARIGTGAVHLVPLGNPAWGGGRLRVHLPGHDLRPQAPPGELGDLGVFQLALSEQRPLRRRLTYRALAGVSMGGFGASVLGFRHPERYDALGVLGAGPGPDLTYTLGFLRDVLLAGFCTAQDEAAGRGRIGQRCPPGRAPLPGQGELVGDFEHMPVQTGQGIGLTLSRSLYLRAQRDLARAVANWAYHNPDPGPGGTYLPPGVPADTLSQPPEQACRQPVVLRGTAAGGTSPFFDGRYNPEGRYDVITFCDGGEAEGQPGVFDDTRPQQDPTQILLAVDLDGNGRRDRGEPVLLQQQEPFADVGPDGLPSQHEPGYDPHRNPDPAGDDYHYLKNPSGTEGNGRYDPGEPFADVGLDGVGGRGCPAGSRPGCYDLGEGNGRHDVARGMLRWQAHDPHTLIEHIPLEQLARLDLYYDAGIRDFFNAHVSTNALFGALAARGQGTVIYDGFPALLGLGPEQESSFRPLAVDPARLGRRVYVRYGHPGLSEAEAARTGDGRHVGTPEQAVSRLVLLLSFLLSRWPDGDRSLQPADDPRLVPRGLVLTGANGRQTPYGLVLPPGYFAPENAAVRYPVVYVGHGYGMEPEELARSVGSLVHSLMSAPQEGQRLPKAVLVFVDGRCRPGGQVSREPLPAWGDLCETGAFYTNHPEGTYQGEDLLEELHAYLARHHRLREPAEVEWAD
ncbi:MAG: hypothetical protein RMK29_10435 [Myxococcales bacterium]|nr:hypothetical protein [Myxococcota bacterium]MDW8282120.1 hypothetical protein [Myxococcales bacterium]